MIKSAENTLNKELPSENFTSVSVNIDKINFDSLINYAKRNRKKTLYWAKPSEDFVFLAFDKILNFSGNVDTLISEIEKFKNNLKYPVFTDENKIPFVVGGVKFNNGAESVWRDFSLNEWFVPRFVFQRNNG